VALRVRAVKMGGFKPGVGLFRSDDDTLVCSETEEQIYEALGCAGFHRDCAKIWARDRASRRRPIARLVKAPTCAAIDCTRGGGNRLAARRLAEMGKPPRRRALLLHRHPPTIPKRSPCNGAGRSPRRRLRQAGERAQTKRYGIESFRDGMRHLRDAALDLANDALAALDLVIGA